MMHFIRKVGRTLHILTCLGMARLFGEYVHSGWNGSIDFARYRWRGRDWIIPTSAAQDDPCGLGIDRSGPIPSQQDQT